MPWLSPLVSNPGLMPLDRLVRQRFASSGLSATSRNALYGSRRFRTRPSVQGHFRANAADPCATQPLVRSSAIPGSMTLAEDACLIAPLSIRPRTLCQLARGGFSSRAAVAAGRSSCLPWIRSASPPTARFSRQVGAYAADRGLETFVGLLTLYMAWSDEVGE